MAIVRLFQGQPKVHLGCLSASACSKTVLNHPECPLLSGVYIGQSMADLFSAMQHALEAEIVGIDSSGLCIYAYIPCPIP